MTTISKWKSGIWFCCAANCILAPIGIIVYFIMESTMKVAEYNTSPSITEETISGMIGAVIGYALCVFFAIHLYKSEQQKCNNNRKHMKLFIKTGFMGYLKLLMCMTVILIIPALIWGATGSKSEVSISEDIPDTLIDENGNYCNVSTGTNGHPFVYLPDGSTRSIWKKDNCYMDKDGNEYYTTDHGMSMNI